MSTALPVNERVAVAMPYPFVKVATPSTAALAVFLFCGLIVPRMELSKAIRDPDTIEATGAMEATGVLASAMAENSPPWDELTAAVADGAPMWVMDDIALLSVAGLIGSWLDTCDSDGG